MRDVGESRPRQTETGGLARGRQFLLMSIRDAQRMVVRALDDGVDDDRPFLVMEFVRGESLADYLEREGRMAIDLALDLSCVNDNDARGLGVLAAVARGARQRGITVSVIAASSRVQRLVDTPRSSIAGCVERADQSCQL